MPSTNQSRFRKAAENMYSNSLTHGQIIVNQNGDVRTTHTGGAWVDMVAWVPEHEAAKYDDDEVG